MFLQLSGAINNVFMFDFMQGLPEDLRTAHFLSMMTGVLNSHMYS